MTCLQCRDRLFPEDPTASPMLSNGRRLAPLCETCSRYETHEYFIEKMAQEVQGREIICTVHGCPIWKTVAQLKNDILSLRAELAHVNAKASEKKVSKSKEGYW